MSTLKFKVGDKVLASRDESGGNHEEGEVVDSYELLIGEESRPMVVVLFADGERKYMTGTQPNVLAVDAPEEKAAEGGEAAADDGEAKTAGADNGDLAAAADADEA